MKAPCKKDDRGGCVNHTTMTGGERFSAGHTDDGEPVCGWWAWMFIHDGDCAGCDWKGEGNAH